MSEDVIKNKIVKFGAKKFGATDEQMDKLTDMFSNGTTIEVLTEASAQEIIDDGKSFWTKIKEKFRQVK
jgi:hypothetical protein